MRLAKIHEEHVTYEVSKLSETMEPLLLGIMGVMVGVLLLGVSIPFEWLCGCASRHARRSSSRLPQKRHRHPHRMTIKIMKRRTSGQPRRLRRSTSTASRGMPHLWRGGPPT